MATNTSRATLKQYCLRALGAPVLTIEIDDEQLDDRVDEALQKYREYHYDGTLETYLKYQLTSTDITNQYIPIDNSSVIGIRDVLMIPSTATTSMWSMKYQTFLNEIYNFTSVSYSGYVITQQHLRNIEMLFTVKPTIRFNKNIGRLYIDQDWSLMIAGAYIIIHCSVVTEPETYTKIYDDIWIKKYTTALCKRQWGNNLKKYSGIQMLGGVSVNGQQIHDEAVIEIKELEDELENTYSYPTQFYVG